MHRSKRAALQCLVLAFSVGVMLGAAGDGGCGEKSAEELCQESGGTWTDAEFWPPACGEDPLIAKGAPAPAGEKVCVCPSNKPSWTNGVGCRHCKVQREYCQETGGTWGPAANWPAACGDDPLTTKGPAAAAGESVCTCPADKPNWTADVGCRHCKTQREFCTETGGKWGAAANWSTPCGQDPLDTPGPAAKPGESVCTCAADKPNWTADIGCRKCDTVRDLCTRTGGKWGVAANWSTPCGQDPLDTLGPAAKPGEKVCTCAADKPNWTDGIGCRKCDTVRELCTRTGGTWGLFPAWSAACGDDPVTTTGPAAKANEKVCRCGAAKPNWTSGVGCQACRIIRCRGTAQTCGSLVASDDQCWQQQGCSYVLGQWIQKSFSKSCCKTCTTGCACGDSCISCSKTCTKPAGCACNSLSSSSYTDDNGYFDWGSVSSDNDYDANPSDSSSSSDSNDYDPYGSSSSSDDNDYDADPYGSSSSSDSNPYDPYGSSSSYDDNDYDPNPVTTTPEPEPVYYYTGDKCIGIPKSCDVIEDATMCTRQLGCYWKN